MITTMVESHLVCRVALWRPLSPVAPSCVWLLCSRSSMASVRPMTGPMLLLKAFPKFPITQSSVMWIQKVVSFRSSQRSCWYNIKTKLILMMSGFLCGFLKLHDCTTLMLCVAQQQLGRPKRMILSSRGSRCYLFKQNMCVQSYL